MTIPRWAGPETSERELDNTRAQVRRQSLRRLRAFSVILLAVLAGCHLAVKPDRDSLLQTDGPYRYPVSDPIAASVVGTPVELQPTLPRDILIEQAQLPLLVHRRVPDVLWYEDAYRYSLAAQPGEAPLIFIVAGTNASHNARFSVFLQKVFYMAGYHAVSLSSPTYPNFMVTASSTGVPGRTSQDAADLYAAMQQVLADVRQRVAVSSVSLAGYSLGGWVSAFVANLDAKEGALRFDKVLLINPPVSLYRSSRVLDRLLTDNLPGGVESLDAFVDRVLARLTPVYQRSEAADFSQDFLYRAYQQLEPSPQELKALAGVAFRLSAANIAFTADVISHSGYLVPPGRRLTVASNLSPYFGAAMRRGFVDYLDDLLDPYYERLDPSITRQELIAESSMERIAPFLASSPNIGLVTNEDDIILASGDIEFLKRTFGERATIFPNGGHCGNIQDRHVVAAMLRFLAQ